MSDANLRDEVQDRVYSQRVNAESTFRIEGEVAIANVQDIDAEWRVDDISNGNVALVAHSNDPEVGSYGKLDAQSARQLGNALIAAAEYAEEQEGDE